MQDAIYCVDRTRKKILSMESVAEGVNMHCSLLILRLLYSAQDY